MAERAPDLATAPIVPAPEGELGPARGPATGLPPEIAYLGALARVPHRNARP
jgi:hypothetical protein